MKSNSPLYKQIANDIKNMIQEGIYKPNEAIPAENQLTMDYSASRVTVRKAVDTLVDLGLLERKHGSGTYVKNKYYEHKLYELKGFTEDIGRYGAEIRNEILKYEIIKAPIKVANQLKIEENTGIYFIRRKRFADNKVLIVEDTFLPITLFPDLTYETMLHSKYDFIENHKHYKIKESHQVFLPILPNSDIREILNIKENIPILKLESTGILTDGTCFEYSEVYFKSEEYSFTITAQRNLK
jgi:GntR family mannosyl-D-glycerate transport/metabolism transcriptional repressor